jgi:hypothetical protein
VEVGLKQISSFPDLLAKLIFRPPASHHFGRASKSLEVGWA